MKKIFIWCPFIDYVGTTISSKNSINALSKFGNKNFSLTVINVFGEWNFYLDNEDDIVKIIETQMNDKKAIDFCDEVIDNNEKNLLLPKVLKIHEKILKKSNNFK